VAGDVMIASIAFGLDTPVITPPAGWTLVRRITSSSGSFYSMAIFRRVADASDASVSSYVFDIDNPGNGWVGGIQSFSGVDTTTPIDVENGQSPRAPRAMHADRDYHGNQQADRHNPHGL